MALGAAAQYGVGQMVQGAQFEGQVGRSLDQNFRQLNPMSETGFGFGRQGKGQIADVVREMGNKEMLSSPQEMLRIMEQGAGMGVFRAVQDAKQFKTKFKEMISSLKEISTTMNTTLEGAIPFLQGARQMGFWTPQDITRNAQMTKQTAAATGMTVAQTQGMMAQGAGMARQIGARGYSGAEGMARSMQLVGGAVRGGSISEQQLSEVTGGLQGPEAIQAMAGQMQSSATRFAGSNVARWMIAGLGRNNFKSLDQGKLSALLSGNMTIGQIGSSARGNIGKQGAFNFVQNERKLREELVKRGPEAQFGLVRGLVGGHLYDESSKGQYISRRIIQRFMGGSAEQADMMAKMARDMPQIMRENQQRSSATADQEVRNRDQLMNESYEGLKRRATDWWRKNVSDPLQKFGADVSRGIGHAYEDVTSKLFGTAVGRYRFRGIEKPMMHALQTQAAGDESKYVQQFASREEMAKFASSPSGGGGMLGMVSALRSDALRGVSFGSKETQDRFQQSLYAATTGDMTQKSASALGFQGTKEADKALTSAKKEMSSDSFRGQAFLLAQKTGLSGYDLAQKMVTEIKAGKMGGEALRQLVATGGSAAAYRLAAAQTNDQRQSRGGIDMSGMAEAAGVISAGGDTQTQEKLSRRLESAEAAIAGAATTKTQGLGFLSKVSDASLNVSKGEVAALVEKGGDDLREAMTMIGSGRTAEERAKNTAEGRAKILALAANKDKFSDKDASILRAMGDPNAPGNKEMTRALEDWGGTARVRAKYVTNDAVKTRMGRFRDALGKQRERVLEGMDQAGGLGKAVRQLTDATSVEQYKSGMSALIAAAGSADPAQAARAAELLKGFDAGETLVSAIEGSSQVSGAAKALSSRRAGINQRLGGAQVLAQASGIGKISRKELEALEAGGTRATKMQEQILARVDPLMRNQAKDMLQAVRDKDMSKMIKVGRDGINIRALGGLADPDKDILAKKVREMRPTDTSMGGPGSPKGQHITLMKIADLLSEIKDNKGKGLAPTEKPP